MLKRAGQNLLTLGSRCISSSARQLEEAAKPAGPQEFLERWTKVAPSTLLAPELPSDFFEKSGSESAAEGDKFPVNFFTPHGAICQNLKKEEVILPGVNGYFGIKANHVPTIAQLKPGIVELTSGAESEKYFISGGFAFIHPNSVTDICVLEAATLDQFDIAAVKQALSTASQDKGGDDFDAAVSRAALEVYSALDAAMENSK